MVDVAGDRQLDELRVFFERLPAVKKRLLNAAAAEALTQVKLGFRGSKAPNGAPWKPLKVRDGRPLRDTGRLGNSFTVKISGQLVTLGTNVVYARFHQFGTPRIPARPMLPLSGLTPSWNKAITRAVDRAFVNFVKELNPPR